MSGRPSLGPRDNFNIRVPEVVGDLIRDTADERAVSFNAVITEALAAHYGIPLDLCARADREEQLPLSA